MTVEELDLVTSAVRDRLALPKFEVSGWTALGRFRVLVTGSREWKDAGVIRAALSECASFAFSRGGALVVVHGTAYGADSLADSWALGAMNRGWPVEAPERHVADWKGPCVEGRCRPGHRQVDPRGWDTCPAAGFYRNEAMVKAGAALCLAFIVPGKDRMGREKSRGTRHCMGEAKKAGIDVISFEA